MLKPAQGAWNNAGGSEAGGDAQANRERAVDLRPEHNSQHGNADGLSQ